MVVESALCLEIPTHLGCREPESWNFSSTSQQEWRTYSSEGLANKNPEESLVEEDSDPAPQSCESRTNEHLALISSLQKDKGNRYR